MTDEVRHIPGEPTQTYEFEVLSRKFVHGVKGSVIKMKMTALQAEALLRSGAVKLAASPRPVQAVAKKGSESNG